MKNTLITILCLLITFNVFSQENHENEDKPPKTFLEISTGTALYFTHIYGGDQRITDDRQVIAGQHFNIDAIAHLKNIIFIRSGLQFSSSKGSLSYDLDEDAILTEAEGKVIGSVNRSFIAFIIAPEFRLVDKENFFVNIPITFNSPLFSEFREGRKINGIDIDDLAGLPAFDNTQLGFGIGAGISPNIGNFRFVLKANYTYLKPIEKYLNLIRPVTTMHQHSFNISLGMSYLFN